MSETPDRYNSPEFYLGVVTGLILMAAFFWWLFGF
jgi:hypothetical protein